MEFPLDIWRYIQTFFIPYYWRICKKYRHVLQATDLYASDYYQEWYWSWRTWRINNGYEVNDIQPKIPKRFLTWEDNPSILSIIPPVISNTYDELQKREQRYRQILYGRPPPYPRVPTV